MNKDIREVVRAAALGGRYTLATVVGIAGSSYRRPGARMLIDERGKHVGSISGGCLERTLVTRGRWMASEGPRLLRFSTSAEPDETELSYLGCGGTIDVLLENVTVDEAPAWGHVELLRWVYEQRAPAVLATVIRGSSELPLACRVALTPTAHECGTSASRLWSLCHDHARQVLAAGRSTRRTYTVAGTVADEECEVFFEYIPPVHELLVCGRHHDVQPVVGMARMLGWQVTVAAGRTPAAELGTPDAIIPSTPDAVGDWARARPEAAVVLMTHSLALDRQMLGALLGVPRLAYLGLLGPFHRTRDILEQLESEGVSLQAAADGRLRAPIGLDLGGDGPAAIALSIIADLQAVWAGRSARPLCQTEHRAIHASAQEAADAPHDDAPNDDAPHDDAPNDDAPNDDTPSVVSSASSSEPSSAPSSAPSSRAIALAGRCAPQGTVSRAV
ncbi:MAG: XdhC family protein [Myxococcota bacterium]